MIRTRGVLRNSLRNRKFESRDPEDIFWRQFHNHLATLRDIFDELKSVKRVVDVDEFNTFRNAVARIYDLCADLKDELTNLQQKCDDNL